MYRVNLNIFLDPRPKAPAKEGALSMYLKFRTFIRMEFTKKLTTIKLNKPKFKKIAFSSSKVNFALVKKKS